MAKTAERTTLEKLESIAFKLREHEKQLQEIIFEINEVAGDRAVIEDIAEYKRGKFTLPKGGCKNDQFERTKLLEEAARTIIYVLEREQYDEEKAQERRGQFRIEDGGKPNKKK